MHHLAPDPIARAHRAELYLALLPGRIAELLAARGLNWFTLSKLSGVDKASLSRFRHGKTRLDMRSVLLIADALECSLEALFCMESAPHGARTPADGLPVTPHACGADAVQGAAE